MFTAKKLEISTTNPDLKEKAFVLWFEQVGIADVPLVQAGGNNRAA